MYNTYNRHSEHSMPPRKRARTEPSSASADVPPAVFLAGGAPYPEPFVDLWRAGTLCDVEVACGEGPALQADRKVLAACSSYICRISGSFYRNI